MLSILFTKLSTFKKKEKGINICKIVWRPTTVRRGHLETTGQFSLQLAISIIIFLCHPLRGASPKRLQHEPSLK